MDRRPTIKLACLVLLILAVHSSVVWLLLKPFFVILKRVDPQGLQLVFVAPAPPAVERASPLRERSSIDPRLRFSPPRQPANTAPIQPPPRGGQDDAGQPPVDWSNELSQVAKNAAADDAAGHILRDFGFPRRPAAAPKPPPQFGWDHAATHRLESIEGGGMLVNLSDDCVLVFLPLPFFVCASGVKDANGELFKHMQEARQAKSASTAP